MSKIVVLNAGKMNFDKSLDLNVIAEGTGRELVIWQDSKTEEIPERCRDAEVIITKELVLPPEMVKAFPESLRLIVEAGTGYNNIPLEAAREKNITVCNIPAYSSERVAHTAIMLMLNLASSMGSQIRMLERGDRKNFTEHLHISHTELNAKTLGVIGAGNIGKKVIRIARAMDMEVLVYTRTVPADAAADPGIRYVGLEELLRNSDYVSLHCPLSEATRHIIDEKALAMMKPGAFLINTSRGPLVDEPALIRALQEGRLAGAGLDVQEQEPPAGDNPLYDMENVILTPHMGWKGKETRQRLISIIAQDVQSFLAGHSVNVVS